jgi:hypothetical protein
MPEELNAEVAGALAENAAVEAQDASERARWRERVEIVEAILLAAVAIATAWSGYQAARWDGRQAELYGMASTTRIRADEATTLGGQQRLLDVTTFNTWIEAQALGKMDLAELYERRFSPEYKVAFDAWIAVGGLTDPNAPPGPSFMPEYENRLLEQGAQLNERATHEFDEGTTARGHADDYVRTTVVLATVLFLLALAQRFRIPKVRIGLLIVSGALMAYGLIAIVLAPRF